MGVTQTLYSYGDRMSIEVMKQALEALNMACAKYGDVGNIHTDWGKWDAATTALRQAIEQAEKQEPVAWLVRDYVDGFRYVSSTENPSGTIAKLSEPLYTAPPRKEWVGLTDEERNLVLDKNTWASGYASWKQFAIDIEAKLKEKNGV